MTTSGNCAFSPKLPFFLRHSFQKDLSPDQLQKSAIRLINFRKEGLVVTFLVWIALFSCLRPTWSCVQGGMFLQGRWFTQTNIRFVCSRRFVEATTRFVRTTPRDFWRSENWCISTNFCHPGGFCIALQGISPLPNDFAIQRENSFSSSRCPPDIDEIRWQNSSGADSRLIDPPSPTTDLQRQVTYIDTVLHTYL